MILRLPRMAIRPRIVAIGMAALATMLGSSLPAAGAAANPQPGWVAANGGHTGATVYALARDPNTPATRYAGTIDGFARSVDNGGTWSVSNSGLPPACQVYALLVLRQQPRTLLGGCGGTDYGNGLYRSDDRGGHWRANGAGILANTAINALAQSPGRPDTLLAASDTGIYRTIDGGRSWTLTLKGQAGVVGGIALTRDPFASLTYYAIVSTGMVKSVDDGRTWFAINNDLGSVGGMDAIVTDSTRRDRLFLGTTDSGLYRSTDGGNSWVAMSNAPSHIYALLAQPLRAVPAAQLTPDLALHLKKELAPPVKPRIVKGKKPKRLPPHIPETALILAGTDSGVQASIDGGESWSNRTTDANRSLAAGAPAFKSLPDSAVVYTLLSFGRSAEIVAGGTTDGIYRSMDLGRSWRATALGLPRDLAINTIAVDPAAPGTVYFGTEGDGVEFSQSSGGTLDTMNDGLPSSANVNVLLIQPARSGRMIAGLGAPSGGVYVAANGGGWTNAGLRRRFVTAIAVDPHDPDTLYAGLSHDGIGWSADGGLHWRILNHGLPPSAPVLALAVDPHDALRILAGTDRGLFVTTDQGDSWAMSAASGLPQGAITALLNDPLRAHAFLAGTQSGLYRSLDGGATWQSNNTAVGAEVHGLARDSHTPGLLLAATAAGIYQSRDDGATWSRLASGIPTASEARAVAVAGPVSYASTPYGAYFLSPTGPVQAISGGRYFTLTGHNILPPFLSFWQAHGGIAVFGPPRTEAMAEGGIIVQYFQRARLEYHPGPRLVSLTPLGSAAAGARHFPGIKPFTNGPVRIYVPPTQHSLGAPFLDFWRAHGGGAVFGLPISEVLHETNGDGTGNAYVLQYFQNARLEYHPENKGTAFELQLGLLGDQQLRSRGWLQ